VPLRAFLAGRLALPLPVALALRVLALWALAEVPLVLADALELSGVDLFADFPRFDFVFPFSARVPRRAVLFFAARFLPRTG
jgi:hypothetical protein